MRVIPHKEKKIDYLIKHYGTAPGSGLPYYQEIRPAVIKLRHEKFLTWADQDIFNYFKIELHHRLPDTAKNIKNYPLFIHSILNLVPLHKGFHQDHKFFWFITPARAGLAEKSLEKNPARARFVNEIY